MKVLVLCYLFAVAALAVPLRHSRPRQGFSVHQVEASAPKRSLFDRHLQTARKYGGHIPKRLQIKLLDLKAAYSATASPYGHDSFYLTPVTIGGQTLNLNIDTGSSDLWVYSSQTPNTGTDRTLYDASTGQLLDGEKWAITYGDGSGASGDVYADTVDIGGLTVTGQAIEVATALVGSWGSPDQDGLLGLAFSNINTVRPTQQNTFFDNAVAQGLQQQLFAVSLKHAQPGSYDFGFIDPNKYTGDITYIPLSQAAFWQVSDGALGETILDTGTTLMYLPLQVVQDYYSQIPGSSNAQGWWTFPCSQQVPDFIFTLASYQTGVKAAFMNFGQVDAENCLGGLQDRDSLGLPVSILGDAWLKDKYVVFDLNGGYPQVGIASAPYSTV